MVPIDTIPDEAVERLLDRAFGCDRHARTAYRLRAGTWAIPGLSFALVEGDALLGSIQCWPVQFDGDDGTVWPLVLIGPVAIVPERQQEGLGRRLMEAALAAATGGPPLTLIGDPEYYGRFFGFDAAATGSWRLPGPVERHRLLARGVNVPAIPGVLGPRRHATAAA
ncbi:MAG: N-acetyltransferase [Sphingomonas phyllosphaerae]